MSTTKVHSKTVTKTDERDAIIARQADRLRELSRQVEDRDVKLQEARRSREVFRVLATDLFRCNRKVYDYNQRLNVRIDNQRKELAEVNRRMAVCRCAMAFVGGFLVVMAICRIISLFA